MTTITSIVVDNQRIFSAGLRAYFSSVGEPKVEVAHEAKNAEELLLLLGRNQAPDLIFLDLNLPDQDGLLVIPEIKKRAPEARIMVLTSYSDYKFVGQALKNGADGYILKSNEPVDLLEGVIEVMAGNTYIAPGLHISTKYWS